MMEKRVSVSVKRIMEEVYALSAMRGYSRVERERVPMLTEDNAEALSVIVTDGIAATMIKLLGVAKDVDFGEPGSDVVEITIDVTDGRAVGSIRRGIEIAVVSRVMSTVMLDVDVAIAEEYGRRWDTTVDNLRYLASADSIFGDIRLEKNV